MTQEETKRKAEMALAVLTAVADCIREVGAVPSGHLEDKNHLLTWVGPKKEGGK